MIEERGPYFNLILYLIINSLMMYTLQYIYMKIDYFYFNLV